MPFTRNPRNGPKHIFTLPDILYHISLTAFADCLQFGMQETNKHVIFASKFGKNQPAISKLFKTKINYIQIYPGLPYQEFMTHKKEYRLF